MNTTFTYRHQSSYNVNVKDIEESYPMNRYLMYKKTTD